MNDLERICAGMAEKVAADLAASTHRCLDGFGETTATWRLVEYVAADESERAA